MPNQSAFPSRPALLGAMRSLAARMSRSIAIAALIGPGVAVAADPGPQFIGGGTDAVVVYAQPSRNVVGGGIATIEGGDVSQRVAYGATTGQSRSGLVARVTGGGDETALHYMSEASAAPAATATLAGQPRRRGG